MRELYMNFYSEYSIHFSTCRFLICCQNRQKLYPGKAAWRDWKKGLLYAQLPSAALKGRWLQPQPSSFLEVSQILWHVWTYVTTRRMSVCYQNLLLFPSRGKSIVRKPPSHSLSLSLSLSLSHSLSLFLSLAPSLAQRLTLLFSSSVIAKVSSAPTTRRRHSVRSACVPHGVEWLGSRDPSNRCHLTLQPLIRE